MVEQVQWMTVIPMLLDRIWGWFIEAAYTAGLIPTADVPAEWSPPRFESVNPWQDAQADLLEVRAGFVSAQEMAAKRGYDWRAVLEEQAEYLREAGRLGLAVVSDPRRVTEQGFAQQKDPLAVEDDAGEGTPRDGGEE